MSDYSLDLSSARFIGNDLQRPECVLATASGTLYTSDWRGGVVRIRPDGSQDLLTGRTRPDGSQDFPAARTKSDFNQGFLAAPTAPPRNVDPLTGRTGPEHVPLKPNGIELEPHGTFLLADLSDERAGVWRLHPNGEVTPFLLEIDGRPIHPVNFVHRDARGRTWISVSTRLQPRGRDYRADAASGYIVLVDERGARIVADGLGYANECKVDPSGRWLYVNETFGRRLTRFRIPDDGPLTSKEVVASFGHGTFPDGLAFDGEGGIWIASIVSNRLLRVDPSGTQAVVLEDADPEHVRWVEDAFQAGTMERVHLDTVRSRVLKNISSVAFGGPDLRTLYLGCLLDDRIAVFDAPVAGAAPVHWHYGSADFAAG